jgi:hypothetical protein
MPSIVKQLLGESRPTNAGELASKIANIPGFEKVDIWTQSDGYAILIRSKEGQDTGQAYEVQIRPAAYGKHPSMQTNYGTGRGMVPKRFAHAHKDRAHKAAVAAGRAAPEPEAPAA